MWRRNLNDKRINKVDRMMGRPFFGGGIAILAASIILNDSWGQIAGIVLIIIGSSYWDYSEKRSDFNFYDKLKKAENE